MVQLLTRCVSQNMKFSLLSCRSAMSGARPSPYPPTVQVIQNYTTMTVSVCHIYSVGNWKSFQTTKSSGTTVILLDEQLPLGFTSRWSFREDTGPNLFHSSLNQGKMVPKMVLPFQGLGESSLQYKPIILPDDAQR
jgi:hypothetical protein